MKEKTKFKAKKILWGLAIISTCVATFEGMLFYNSTDYPNIFYRILLILQNSIYAFAFKPSISLDKAMNFMENKNFLYVIVGYAYGVAVFTAPYCTIAALYKMLERLFRLLLVTRKRKGNQNIVIFGYNDDVKTLLNNSSLLNDCSSRSPLKRLYYWHKPEYSIHIVGGTDISSEEKYKLMKRGFFVHQFDFLKTSQEELEYLIQKTFVADAKFIILMEENSMHNFSLLQLFQKNELKGNRKNKRIVLQNNTKIFCRCEEYGIERLIADYYDCEIKNLDKNAESFYDLELFSFPELQVRAMYQEVPLYTYFLGKTLPMEKWDLNLLIIGFGNVGQQALLQAMNNGVFHGNNSIKIDVIDYNIEEKAGIFANCFHDEMFEMDNTHFKVNPKVADGSLDIYFHNMDVRYQQFHSLIKDGAKQYNYVVIALSDTTTAMHCAMELEESFKEYGKVNVPIVMRLDYDKRVAEYVANNQSTFCDVMIMKGKADILTLNDIINDNVDRKAKEYHSFYSTIQIGKNEEKKRWECIPLFMRDSNRAVANHEDVKACFVEKMIEKDNTNKKDMLESLVGKEGKLMKYDGNIWTMNGDLAKILHDNSLGYELSKMEHRRWTYFMLSRGWSTGEKITGTRLNPWMIPQEELMEKDVSMCQYDLMYLMAEYKKQYI